MRFGPPQAPHSPASPPTHLHPPAACAWLPCQAPGPWQPHQPHQPVAILERPLHAAGPGTILTDSYCLLPGDLRQAGAVLGQLQQAGLQPQEPTLVLAECVLVYMEPQHSAALVAALGQLLSAAALVIYEQVCVCVCVCVLSLSVCL